MKIGLCGAGGTGKGTLVRALVDKLPNLNPIYSSVEYIGKIIKPDSKSFSEFSNEERALFQYSIVSGEIQNEWYLANLNRDYIVERSVFDYLAYWGVNNSGGGYESFKNYVLSAYEKNPYDIIFFLPIEFEATDLDKSSWKERDSESRKQREQILKDILFGQRLAKYSGLSTLSGSVEQRLSFALNVINH